MKKDIRQEWFLAHPPDKVWEYLTNSELLAAWLMENTFKPIKGHQFTFNARPKVKIGFDGMVYCEVLEIIPPLKLSYSWRGGPGKGKITLDSVVTWTLSPQGEGTLLVLEHTGFHGFKNFIPYLIMNKGWKTNVRKRFVQALREHP